jgi:hypothetical protein
MTGMLNCSPWLSLRIIGVATQTIRIQATILPIITNCSPTESGSRRLDWQATKRLAGEKGYLNQGEA